MSLIQKIKALKKNSPLLDSTLSNLEYWIEAAFLPDWGVRAIEELLAQEAWDELNDRFYKTLEFGTGGMRGRTFGKIVAPSEQGSSVNAIPEHPNVGSRYLNDFNIIRATIGLYHYCLKYSEVPTLVIAHDVRHFSKYFCDLAASTWISLGGEVFVFKGPRSTPQLSFTVRYKKAIAGIVITASHNPPHDNGYKVYFKDGGQIVSPHAEGIIREVNKVELSHLADFYTIQLDGVREVSSAAEEAYMQAVRSVLLNESVILKNRPKVVFTPIHGTGGVISIPLLRAIGVDVVEEKSQVAMDGSFPTVISPNPENGEALQKAIQKAQEVDADAVLGTDPDADRMGVAVREDSGSEIDFQSHHKSQVSVQSKLNHRGKMRLLSGNTIAVLLAEYRIRRMKELGILPAERTQKAALVKTFVTTPMLDAIAERHGLKVINTLTGFKWIGEKLSDYERELREKLSKDDTRQYDQLNWKDRAELMLKESTFYVFGGEESYGTLASDSVRDKDANAATLLFCELIASLKSQGKTVIDHLNALYCEYGYYRESLVNLFYEGALGSMQIRKILESYRENPPEKIGNYTVHKIQDFGKDIFFDADGKRIPAEDFFILELSEGYRCAVRGSGTEPKMKFYLFGRENVSHVREMQRIEDETGRKLELLGRAIEADARKRGE